MLGFSLYLLLTKKRIIGLNEYFNPRPMGMSIFIISIIFVSTILISNIPDELISYLDLSLSLISGLFSLIGALIITKNYEHKIRHDIIVRQSRERFQETNFKFDQIEIIINQIKRKESELKRLDIDTSQGDEVKKKRKMILKEIRSLKKDLRGIKRYLNIKP